MSITISVEIDTTGLSRALAAARRAIASLPHAFRGAP